MGVENMAGKISGVLKDGGKTSTELHYSAEGKT